MDKYMKIAKDLSEDNLKTNVGGPFGACIVKNGTIIGKGSNHVLSNNDPTAHAEIIAPMSSRRTSISFRRNPRIPVPNAFDTDSLTAKLPAKKEGRLAPAPVSKKVIKTIHRQAMFPAKTLESEAEIDAYVEKIREQMKRLLNGCDGIRLS